MVILKSKIHQKSEKIHKKSKKSTKNEKKNYHKSEKFTKIKNPSMGS